MKLNNTSQYAIRIMTYIVKHESDTLFNAKVIAEELNIPYKYLAAIMSQLVDAKILTSSRGRDGGYGLASLPSDIKIVDVINAVKECLHDTECLLGTKKCSVETKCVLHDMLIQPKKDMLNVFNHTTLEELKTK